MRTSLTLALRAGMLLFLGGLAACGGGGGSGSGPSSSSTPPTSNEPPPPSRWSAAAAFGTAQGNPNEASLGIDNNGNSLFVVSTAASSQILIQAFRKPAGAGWTPGQAISPLVTPIAFGTHVYSGPQVRVDDAGNALAGWSFRDWSSLSDRNFVSNVYVSRRETSSGTWSSPQVLQSDPSAYAKDIRIAMERNGTAWAVWTERTVKDTFFSTQDKYAIFAAKFTPGIGWSAAERVTSDFREENGFGARVATNQHGNPRVIVVWNSVIPLESNLYYSARSASGIWSALIPVAHALPANGLANNYTEYDLAVDGNDNAIAVWSEYDGTRHTVLARHFTAAGGWEPTLELPLSSNDDALAPQLAMDSDGNAFVAWHEFDGSAYAIWTARFERTVGWTVLELISSISLFGDDSTFPRIAFDAAGNAAAVWTKYERVRNRPVVRANFYSRTAGWGADETISGGAGIAAAADVAMSPSGHATAVWWEESLNPATPNVFFPMSATRSP